MTTDPGRPTESDYPPGHRAWLAVIILMFVYIFSMLDRNIITLFAEEIRAYLRISDVKLGMLFGPAFALSYAIGALPFGWAIDRFDRRRVLWLGVTIWSLATAACGMSRSFMQMFAARAFVGAGEAVLVPGNQSLLADMFPPDRLAFPISVYSLGSRVGQGVSLIIGGSLTTIIAPTAVFTLWPLGDLQGWQLIFVIVGFPGLLMALLIFLIPEPQRRHVTATPRAEVTFRAYLTHARSHARFFAGLHAGAVIAIMVTTALAAWTPVFFQRAHGWPVEHVGLWLGLAIVVGPTIGMPVHGLISDFLFRKGTLDAPVRHLGRMVFLATIPLVAGYLVANPWLGLFLICLGQGLVVATTVLMPTSLQLMVPSAMRGKAASFLLLATALASVSAGPAIVAGISDWLLGGPDRIGDAVALVSAVGLPAAALCFSIAAKPLRVAIAARHIEKPMRWSRAS